MRVLLDTLPPGTDIAQRRALAHGPHHRSGDTGRPEMGWIERRDACAEGEPAATHCAPVPTLPEGSALHAHPHRPLRHGARHRRRVPARGRRVGAATHRPRLPRLRQPGRGAVGAALALRRPGAPGLRPQRHRLRGVLQDGPARGAGRPRRRAEAGAARAARRRPRPEAGRRRPAARGLGARAREDGPRAPDPGEAARRSRHRRRVGRRRGSTGPDSIPAVLLAGGLGAVVVVGALGARRRAARR